MSFKRSTPVKQNTIITDEITSIIELSNKFKYTSRSIDSNSMLMPK